MSLLMDALKKAEEEKKKAAKRLEQVEATARAEIDEEDSNSVEEPADKGEQLTDTMKLSLEPLDISGGSKPIPELEVATEEVTDGSEDIVEDNTNELPLNDPVISEDLTLKSPVAEESFEQTQEAIDLNDTTIIEGLSTEDASAPFDDTFHGVLFEGDEQETEVYEETLPGVPADQLIKDMGGGEYQPTPVAAQTVFSAGKTKSKSKYSWGVFLVLAVLAFGSFAVFYYFTITPVARKLPSPHVARGIESTIIPAPAPAPAPAIAESDEAYVVSVTKNSLQTEVDPVVNLETVENEQELSDIQEQGVEKETLENVDRIESKQEPNKIETVSDNTSDNVNLNIEEDIKKSVVVEDIPPANFDKQPENQEEQVLNRKTESIVQADFESLKISKNKFSPKLNIMLNEAFKAYQAGQLQSSESLYRNILQSEPENRDAHLGLAAIAINYKNKKDAYTHYLKLLEINPDDALALSSLISLSNNSDPVKDESIIKTLLHKEGKVPYLYFALGNIYAKQQRWPEAQQAFFDAYSLDTTNPDYVLNLAISLDKLGQYPTALDYYTVAVELAQRSTVRFNLTSVNERIQVLNKVVYGTL